MRDGAASGDADGYARCSGGGEALSTNGLEAVRLVSMKILASSLLYKAGR